MSTDITLSTSGHSLHGSDAAKRQATAELNFFSYVGDLERCIRIVQTWNLNLKDDSCQDYDGRRPIHVAARQGCYSVIKWLVKEGCGVNPVDVFGRTPLEEAVRGGHKEVAELLMSKGARVQTKDKQLVRLEDSNLSLTSLALGEFQPEWEIDRKDIRLLEKIGEGEFGVVHKAIWHGTYLAVKILKNSSHVALEDFKTELSMFRQCHHPHTVQFMGACTREPPFMIVTEFMNGGSLADVFEHRIALSVRRACEIALDCAKGMAFLHNSKNSTVFIHRDLKPANLMFGGHKIQCPKHKLLMIKETGRVKISDFGLSRSISTRLFRRHAQSHIGDMARSSSVEFSVPEDRELKLGESYKLTGETGSYRYMAPEVFRHENYNEKVDVYAFAMIFYELLEGIAPYVDLDAVSAAKQAAIGHYRPMWNYKNVHGERVPSIMRDLVIECWDPDPSKRPGFVEIVQRLREHLDALKPEKKTKRSLLSSLIRHHSDPRIN